MYEGNLRENNHVNITCQLLRESLQVERKANRQTTFRGDSDLLQVTRNVSQKAIYIQGVTGGTDQTSGGCSLC